MTISDVQRAAVDPILGAHGRNAAKIIPMLQQIQEEFRFLPEEVLNYVAEEIKISPAKLYGIATFYHHFSLEPKGENVVKICDGTACHVKGSDDLIQCLKKSFNLIGKEKTSADGKFTLETVSCLGACGLAPVMVINDQVYGQVSPEMALEITDRIAKGENHDN